MTKFRFLSIAFAFFSAAGLEAYSFSISPGMSILSSKYFDNGRVLTLGTSLSKKYAGFSPEAGFSLIQADGAYREDLSLNIFLLKAGLSRHLFNLTPRNGLSFSFSYGLSQLRIKTKNGSESSFVSWLIPAIRLKFDLTESLGLFSDMSYGYSLDNSNSSLILLGLGLQLSR